ncbi:MAG: pyridoxine 5'-phosphate synthase [Bacteroidaceae bacterium]|nr:pyridoxine 5'-phosphate synthase [Bacteroidaceae bacterium]
MKTKLSVNINKIATIRNARGGNNPDILKVAKDCEAFGADGITVHPRPDERHIRRADVPALQAILRTEFNIEGYPSKEFMDLVLRVRPSQVTLVPDKPDQITSNSGWDTEKEQDFLRDILNDLRTAGIRSSIFIDASPRMAEFAAQAGADRVELYTGPYAHNYTRNPEAAIAPFLETAKRVKQLGIGLNAGHDLSLENLKYFTDVISWVDEVSIGHALVCDALYLGLEKTIEAYQNCLIKK